MASLSVLKVVIVSFGSKLNEFNEREWFYGGDVNNPITVILNVTFIKKAYLDNISFMFNVGIQKEKNLT